MAIELVTGHAGTDHVSSADMGRYHAGVCGPGKYVLATGQQFAATIASANLIRVASGDAVNQGRHITIPQNTYEEAAITNGTQGKARIDVIALRYTKTTQEVEGVVASTETVALAVIKGTEVDTGTTPVAPDVNSGDIFDGAVIDDMPLYHVLITDTSITSVTAVFSVLPNIVGLQQGANGLTIDLSALQAVVSGHTSALTTLQNAITTINTKLGSTPLGTVATTITGAIAELLELINQPIFKIKSTGSDNITIGANSQTEAGARDITVSGYRAIGIRAIGIFDASSGGTKASWCVPTRAYVYRSGDKDKLNYYIWNQNTSSSAKIKFEFSILYAREDLVEYD